MNKKMSILLAAICLYGCSVESLKKMNLEHKEHRWKNYASGEIGCLPEDIEVVEKTDGYTETWTASCKGVDYVCNARSGGNGTNVSCAKLDQ